MPSAAHEKADLVETCYLKRSSDTLKPMIWDFVLEEFGRILLYKVNSADWTAATDCSGLTTEHRPHIKTNRTHTTLKPLILELISLDSAKGLHH